MVAPCNNAIVTPLNQAAIPDLIAHLKTIVGPSHADLTALYVERYMNQGLTRAELQSGRPGLLPKAMTSPNCCGR